uniref:Interferon-induced protein with tetratricopeptide repeats 5-like n=1 Tax=Xiphophorus maculatus TaxID=8083 RepID=A0A3B5Q750_XIPMA
MCRNTISTNSASDTPTVTQLQSHFTWDLKKEDMELENLSTRLEEHITLELGRPGAVALSYSLLAYVRYLQNRPDEALKQLLKSQQTTEEVYGEDSERRLIVTYGDLAWLNYHTGNFTNSSAAGNLEFSLLLLSSQKKYPNSSSDVLHPEVYGEKAWTYLKLSKSHYPKAIKCFERALEVQKDDSEWNAGYAIALFRTERVTTDSAAITQLRRALELSPDDGVLLSMLAVKLGVEKKYEEAKSLVEKTLKVAPDNPHAMRYISKYLRYQGNIEQSIVLLERALERSNTSAFIYHQLGLCYKRKKLNEQKSQHFDKQSIHEFKLRRQCILYLEKAVKIRPSFWFARLDLALMYGEEKDLSRAEEMFQHCFKKSSDKLDSLPVHDRQLIHQRYAEFHLYHTKKQDEAITHYTEVSSELKLFQLVSSKLKQIADSRLSEDKDDSLAYSVLAQVAKAEGDKEKAAELYEKALDCDENNNKYLYALWELRMELH